MTRLALLLITLLVLLSACGGSQEPTPAPVAAAPTDAPLPTATTIPTNTPEPTATPTTASTNTPTPSTTPSVTPSPLPTVTRTATPTVTTMSDEDAQRILCLSLASAVLLYTEDCRSPLEKCSTVLSSHLTKLVEDGQRQLPESYDTLLEEGSAIVLAAGLAGDDVKRACFDASLSTKAEQQRCQDAQTVFGKATDAVGGLFAFYNCSTQP